ncbi:hypothetical protein ACFZCY_45120 [Streptomyces sp. NPDC007983]|uniref:hypothetical protein n=1 Tax=Streptomyces sp. NPDC007983 TaxID=3364800 RepID=UPI0036E60961
MPRQPSDVIRGGGNTDRTDRPERPRARAKWLTASAERDAGQVIGTVFDEAERRDPDREREMLVDGARHQLDVIHDQCDARGLEVRLLTDFVHVLEYPWGAAWCFFARTDPVTETWAGEIALEILQDRAEQVADALEAPRGRGGTGRPAALGGQKGGRLPAGQTPLPRLRHRAGRGLADRDRRDRGGAPGTW